MCVYGENILCTFPRPASSPVWFFDITANLDLPYSQAAGGVQVQLQGTGLKINANIQYTCINIQKLTPSPRTFVFPTSDHNLYIIKR